MHPFKPGLAATLAVILFSFAAEMHAQPVGRVSPAPVHKDVKTVADGNTAFTLDLYNQLRTQDGNLFLSPYSISTALAMTRTGAAGETAAQMDRVLHFSLPEDQLHPVFSLLQNEVRNATGKGCEISVANALWGQQGYAFRKAFIETVSKNYGGGLRDVDFMNDAEGARKTINGWVERETREKIKNLIQPGILTPLTRLVLTNAIYFKGDWATKFDKKNTRDEDFTTAAPQEAAALTVKTPMMNQRDDFRYMENDSFQAVEMPYAGNRLSMVVFLPRKADGLQNFESTLTNENLSSWLKMLREQKVAVTLPKFKITAAFTLNDALGKMGMTDAFSPTTADFSAMLESGKKELYISHVIHKAFVDVNEEGTEAAASTAVVATLKAAPTRPAVFRADHPFVFIIRDRRTGSILFMGRVMDPTSGNDM